VTSETVQDLRELGDAVKRLHDLRRWLKLHGYDEWNLVTITAEKPPALVYVDDRAWRFEGPGTFPTVEQVHRALQELDVVTDAVAELTADVPEAAKWDPLHPYWKGHR
jgi:hypothetical protein